MQHHATEFLLTSLKPARKSAVVDIGANPIDDDPPYKSMLEQGLCTLIGFEPQLDALAILESRKGPLETYLPHAVGDGEAHVLHITQTSGMTSLLRPDPRRLGMFNGFDEWGKVAREVTIETRRLDDIGEVGEIDYLKIDIQGGELMVFRGGKSRLARAVAIHVEVSFVPLYEGQPAFGDIDVELRSMGFLPHMMAATKLWPIAPVVFDADPRKPMHQLLEADVVYVRDFAYPERFDVEQLKHLALLAHCVYDSVDLVYRCLMALVARGLLPDAAPNEFLRQRYAPG